MERVLDVAVYNNSENAVLNIEFIRDMLEILYYINSSETEQRTKNKLKPKQKTYKETEQKVPLMLSIDELANKSGMSPYTIRRWVKEGAIPCIKIGRKNLISWDIFCDFLKGME